MVEPTQSVLQDQRRPFSRLNRPLSLTFFSLFQSTQLALFGREPRLRRPGGVAGRPFGHSSD